MDNRERLARLDDALAASAERFVRFQLEHDTACGARVAHIGPLVLIDGGRNAGPNISRVYGLTHTALDAGRLDADTLEAIVNFFDAGGRAARVFVSTPIDVDARALLHARGFVCARVDSVLARRLDDASVLAGSPSPDVVVERCDDALVWSRALAPAFGTVDESDETLHRRHAPFFTAPNMAFLARRGGEPAGGAVVVVEREVAYFLADGTREEHRGHGVQSALIAARVDAARAAGAVHAFAITEEGVTSERNYLRAGFERLALAEVLVRERASP